MGICELCEREVEKLSKHHLIPKSRGGSKGDIAWFCLSCIEMVHQLIPNKELEKKYSSVMELLQNESVKRYVSWIKKQKKERVTIAKKKRRL